MIMADVFKILFLVLGTIATVVCYWLLFEAVFPRVVEGARDRYERHPKRALLVGLLVTAPTLLLGAAFASAPAALAKFLGITLLLALLLVSLVGSAGLAELVGGRLASAVDAQWPWRRVLRGGTVLAVTFVLPLAGWFVVLPVTLVSGVGAAVLAWRSRPALPEAAPAGAPEPTQA